MEKKPTKKKAATKPPKQQASHEEALAMHKAGKTDKEIAEALGLLMKTKPPNFAESTNTPRFSKNRP